MFIGRKRDNTQSKFIQLIQISFILCLLGVKERKRKALRNLEEGMKDIRFHLGFSDSTREKAAASAPSS